MHGTGPVSEWVARWSHLVPTSSRVLDVASGAGRHTQWFAKRGCRVTAIDRDEAAVAGLHEVARVVLADIESGPWPLPGERFDTIVVTHYLWRPLWPTLMDALAPGGLLIYETFALGHERHGKPSNPNFLLRPGELLELASGLHIVAYEDGLLTEPPRRMQRLVARRAAAVGGAETRGEEPLHAPR